MILTQGSTKCPRPVCRGDCPHPCPPSPQGDPGAASVWSVQPAPAHPPLPRSVQIRIHTRVIHRRAHQLDKIHIQYTWQSDKLMMVENDCWEYINIYSPVDNACHGFDLDCVAKAGKDILGDGARIAGNGDELYIFPLKTKNHIMPDLKPIPKNININC